MIVIKENNLEVQGENIMSQQDVVKELNQQVANWTVAYTKLHNFHWYVKGPNFFSLHEKFEELYNEASQYVDDLAERILAIGGNPVGTLKESLEISIVDEAGKITQLNKWLKPSLMI